MGFEDEDNLVGGHSAISFRIHCPSKPPSVASACDPLYRVPRPPAAQRPPCALYCRLKRPQREWSGRMDPGFAPIPYPTHHTGDTHMPADDKKATKPPSTSSKASTGFSAEERSAIRERAKEQKAQASKEQGERDLLAKIAEMTDTERAIAERIHAIVKANAPTLAPTTWYGMPAYARDGKIICFFQPAQKFKARYSTLGFNDAAHLDDGAMWPTAFALTK